MSNGWVFVGLTGQAKVMNDVLERSGKGWLAAVIDENEKVKNPFPTIPFYFGKDALEKFYQDFKQGKIFGLRCFAITIGNPRAERRRKLSEKLMNWGLFPENLIDPSAIISPYAKIGKGVQIHQGTIIQAFAEIGDFCILNTGAQVDHDCKLANGVEIGPGAVLCGTIEVGENTWIGAGSVVRHCQKIGKNVIVGCGSNVVSDIPDDDGAWVGNPARPLGTLTKRERNAIKIHSL